MARREEQLSAANDARGELERLEALLDRCDRLRIRGLGFDELRELGRLYRRAAGRLARLRERSDDPEAIRYLNAVCVRAYGHLALSMPEDTGDDRPLRARLGPALASTWSAQLAAWALLALGITVGAALFANDPAAVHALMPPSLGHSPAGLDALIASSEARRAFLAPEATPVAHNVLFGSMLFARNTQVGLLAFATGALAAIPTVLLAVYNGILLGAFAAVFFQDGVPVAFLAWILPHGIPEFTAIALCIAGGLVLGRSVMEPGRRSRTAALAQASRPAVLLFAASLPFFLAAALIESFVRESALGVPARLVVAACMAALVAACLLATRALGRPDPPDASWIADLSTPDHRDGSGPGGAPLGPRYRSGP